MSALGHFVGVGVGPGPAGLIPVAALAALQDADRIYLPDPLQHRRQRGLRRSVVWGAFLRLRAAQRDPRKRRAVQTVEPVE